MSKVLQSRFTGLLFRRSPEIPIGGVSCPSAIESRVSMSYDGLGNLILGRFWNRSPLERASFPREDRVSVVDRVNDELYNVPNNPLTIDEPITHSRFEGFPTGIGLPSPHGLL